jgi:hypothetical protein
MHYMFISIPTGTSTLFGEFHFILSKRRVIMTSFASVGRRRSSRS